MVIYPLKMVIFYGFCEKFTTTNRQDFAEVRGPRGVGADEARCGTNGVEGSDAAANSPWGCLERMEGGSIWRMDDNSYNL